jgi:hypothetical protein
MGSQAPSLGDAWRSALLREVQRRGTLRGTDGAAAEALGVPACELPNVRGYWLARLHWSPDDVLVVVMQGGKLADRRMGAIHLESLAQHFAQQFHREAMGVAGSVPGTTLHRVVPLLSRHVGELLTLARVRTEDVHAVEEDRWLAPGASQRFGDCGLEAIVATLVLAPRPWPTSVAALMVGLPDLADASSARISRAPSKEHE